MFLLFYLQLHVRWDLDDKQYMGNAFNKKGVAHLNDMYEEYMKKGNKATWMGESYWWALQDHWVSERFKRIFYTKKKRRKPDKGGYVHFGCCILLGAHIGEFVNKYLCNCWWLIKFLFVTFERNVLFVNCIYFCVILQVNTLWGTPLNTSISPIWSSIGRLVSMQTIEQKL